MTEAERFQARGSHQAVRVTGRIPVGSNLVSPGLAKHGDA